MYTIASMPICIYKTGGVICILRSSVLVVCLLQDLIESI